MDASTQTAAILYGKKSPSSFKARSIRHWADVYLMTSLCRCNDVPNISAYMSRSVI